MADPQMLSTWFNSIDVDRTGTISAQELQRALNLGGLSFSLMACAQVRMPLQLHCPLRSLPWAPLHTSLCSLPCCLQMVRLHDKDHSGTISLQEFQSLHVQLTQIKAAFGAAAAGGDSISTDQLQQLVAQQGAGGAGMGLSCAAEAYSAALHPTGAKHPSLYIAAAAAAASFCLFLQGTG